MVAKRSAAQLNKIPSVDKVKQTPKVAELLTEYSDRFMVGVDTYTPQRWLQINEELVWIREMLSVLPPEAAERIAYKNGEKVIAARFR